MFAARVVGRADVLPYVDMLDADQLYSCYPPSSCPSIAISLLAVLFCSAVFSPPKVLRSAVALASRTDSFHVRVCKGLPTCARRPHLCLL